MDKYYYKECFLEDIYHFEALDVWKELEPGDQVSLYFDKKDADCIQKIKVKTCDSDKVLGVLSEEDSKSMLPFYKCGWEQIFLGKIGFYDKKEENRRIKIVVYIKKSEKQHGI